jgi:hypothetical protein
MRKSRHSRPPTIKPQPNLPSAETIAHLADMVMAGQIIEAALTDGTFVLLMDELNCRGMHLQPRSESEAYLRPFLFRVCPAPTAIP